MTIPTEEIGVSPPMQPMTETIASALQFQFNQFRLPEFL